MKGHEHYREAERLVDAAVTATPPYSHIRDAELIAAAQVHATLAVAAAQAQNAVLSMCGDSNRVTDWGVAIGWDDLDRHGTRAELLPDDPDLAGGER